MIRSSASGLVFIALEIIIPPTEIRLRTVGSIAPAASIVTITTPDREPLGGHVVGEQGAEIIHELVLAMELGATAEDITDTIHIHPTLSEVVNAAAGGVHRPS